MHLTINSPKSLRQVSEVETPPEYKNSYIASIDEACTAECVGTRCRHLNILAQLWLHLHVNAVQSCSHDL